MHAYGSTALLGASRWRGEARLRYFRRPANLALGLPGFASSYVVRPVREVTPSLPRLAHSFLQFTLHFVFVPGFPFRLAFGLPALVGVAARSEIGKHGDTRVADSSRRLRMFTGR